MVSLANALVRDGTARFFRWKRGAKPTRAYKIPVTQLKGDGKMEFRLDSQFPVVEPDKQKSSIIESNSLESSSNA